MKSWIVDGCNLATIPGQEMIIMKNKLLASKRIIILLRIIKSCWQHGFPWLSVSIHPYQLLFFVSPENDIQGRHWNDWCKFLLVHCVSMCRNFKEDRQLWVRPYSSCSVYRVLLVLLEKFVRLEVSGRTTAVLWDAERINNWSFFLPSRFVQCERFCNSVRSKRRRESCTTLSKRSISRDQFNLDENWKQMDSQRPQTGHFRKRQFQRRRDLCVYLT